jgi:hypothetical protein
MLEIGTSGLMSGKRKRATAIRSRTAPFLDSTPQMNTSMLERRLILQQPLRLSH